MEENEGKNIAEDKKQELLNIERYYENVRLELNRIILNDVTIGERNQKEISEDGEEKETLLYNVYIDFKGENVLIATIGANGKLEPNTDLLSDEKYTEEDRAALGDMINRLGLEQEEVDLDKLQEQLKTLEAKTKEELEQARKERKDKGEGEQEAQEEGETEEGEKEEEDGEQEQEENKEEIAKKYNVSKKDIVKLDIHHEKLTEDDNLSGLLEWAEGRENVYVIADKKGGITHMLEKKGNDYGEIEHNMEQTHGNIPNVKIHLMDNDNVREVVPLRIYEIDSKQAFATVRNEWGELETIYCRKQYGEEKYWGTVVPEESGKNVRQQEFDVRSFMSQKNTSTLDLSEKEEEFNRAKELDERGVPSGKKGVQVEEIDGTREQNKAQEKEQIKKDLYKRLGITEQMKANFMPGQLEYLDAKLDKQAEDIQLLMEEDENISYEEAVKKTEPEGERDEGGRTPGDGLSDDPRRSGS